MELGPGVPLTESVDGIESFPIVEEAVTGVLYGWKPPWLICPSGGMPIGWGAFGVDRGAELTRLGRKCWEGGGAGGTFGEATEETGAGSYDLVAGFGDRGYGCVMMETLSKSQLAVDSVWRPPVDSPGI